MINRLRQLTLWNILNFSLVFVLWNVFVFLICLQHKLLPWLLHGLHHPFLSLVFFRFCTLLCNSVFWPTKSLRFLFLLNDIYGLCWNVCSKFGFILRRSQCLPMDSLMFGSVLLYVTTHGIPSHVRLFWLCSKVFLFWCLALSICICTSLSLYPHCFNFSFNCAAA